MSTTVYFQMNTQSNKWFWWAETPGEADIAGPGEGLDTLDAIVGDFFEAQEVSYTPGGDWPVGYGELEKLEDYKHKVVISA